MVFLILMVVIPGRARRGRVRIRNLDVFNYVEVPGSLGLRPRAPE
jgi:hypothetical protein